jgi:flavin reductase (DIM6/NTAB) family NADH-FMN oxidoreductase RutF
MTSFVDTQRALRTALGPFATGVAIATVCSEQGHPLGLTINSFNSVSLDPPLVVWSLARTFAGLAVFEGCEHYAIQILSADQADLSTRFASRDPDKFAGLTTREGLGRAPLFEGTCALFECRNTQRHDGGDHIVFISEVLRFESTPKAPLVFFAGQYHGLTPV